MGLRDFQDEKADVILKCAACTPRLRRLLASSLLCRAAAHAPRSRRYMADEARSLKAYGELPESSACPAPPQLQRCDAAVFRPRVWRERRLLRCALRCRRTRAAISRDCSASLLHTRVGLLLGCMAAASRHLTCAFAFCAVRVNETDTFDEERGENDDFFDFDDVAEI